MAIEQRADRLMRSERQPRNEPRPDHVGGVVTVPRQAVPPPGAVPVPQSRRGSLADQLELSITEIAVMWILHHGVVTQRPLRSLTRDILEFYPAAMDAILRVEGLRDARQSNLRLIYFKGLIVAQTHPETQMIDAIQRANLALEHGGAPAELPSVAAPPSAESLPAEEQTTLAHIADALGLAPRSSH
jgi:hypothetical protein